MSWQAEFGKDFDIPDFVEYLVKKDVLEDSSWHNDVAPSFSAVDEDFNGVRLWVDHPFKSERETNGVRFCVSSQEEGARVGEDLETDDFEEAMRELFDRILEDDRSTDVRSEEPVSLGFEGWLNKYMKRSER